jgi:hypothetical protein
MFHFVGTASGNVDTMKKWNATATPSRMITGCVAHNNSSGALISTNVPSTYGTPPAAAERRRSSG